MSNEQELTDRQIREKEYYEQYAQKFDVTQPIDMSPIHGPLKNIERRPWNSYWRTFELSVDHLIKKQSNGAVTLLDFGCGPGENAIRFAMAGFQVSGFDISEENIKNSKRFFEHHNQTGEFVVSPSETLPFKDHQFDIVVGIDILHHVDIDRSMKELKRILKPGGVAIFREPIEVPFLDWIRNTAIVRFFVPNAASLEAHITEDERKLNDIDLNIIKKHFPHTEFEKSFILSRFDRFIRSSRNKRPSFLEQFDYYFTKAIPAWGQLGGACVIVVKND